MDAPRSQGIVPPENAAGERVERDYLGEKKIPARELRGIHSFRAIENFTVAGRPLSLKLVHAYAAVKKACAVANRECDWLDETRATAVAQACDELASGAFDVLFSLDALQGGAGTSTNMMVNEIVANRANEILGIPAGSVGEGSVLPLEHVNLHQSTNDTYPTALKVCLIGMLRENAEAAAGLQGALQRKEREFADIVTTGRTESQDAVPMTLGSIFSGLAEATGRDRWRTFKCEERLRVVNLGGTAVGTGLTAPRDYIFRAADNLRAITGYPIARAENLVDQTANADSFAEVAGILAAQAANLVKQAKDLRLLAREGDISLAALQAGSSIMPGKVNPVACEAVIQAGMRARVNCALVCEATGEGSLQINEYLPLVAESLIEALTVLSNGSRTLAKAVDGIDANPLACRARIDVNPAIVTAFLPEIGYAGAVTLLEEFYSEKGAGGETVRAFLSRKLGEDLVARTLSPEALSALGFRPERRRDT